MGLDMNLTTYINIFRTHVWDRHIAEMANMARNCTRSGAFIVAADESNGVIETPDFFKYAHTSDLSGLTLPMIPNNNVLWWNGDYPMYEIWRQYSCFDYYIMIEYDTFINCDLDRIVSLCAERKIDLVVHDLKQISAGSHWSYPSVSELGVPTWQALIPFLILSKRMVEVMFETRQTLARQYHEGAIKQWPYCEAFIPTIAMMHSFNLAAVSDFIDASLLRFRPHLSLRDNRLRSAERVAHPVFGGQRFIAAYANGRPDDTLLLSDGYLRPELEQEDLADVAAVLGREVKRFPAVESSMINYPPGMDLARDKPSTQSSWSEWSRGSTAAADACRANSGPLPNDYAFHTGGEPEPWWAVDLVELSRIEAVEILNRPGLESRFCHFRIETSLDGTVWKVQFTKTDDRGVSSAPERPAVFRFTEAVQARHLRIVKLGDGVMHLRRVRVLGTAIDGSLINSENG